MAYSFNGSSQYIKATSAVLTAAPITMAGYFWSTSNSANQVVVQISKSDSTRDWFYVGALGGVDGDPINASTAGPFDVVEADTTSGYTINTWQSALGVFAAANDRAAFLDGGSKGTNTGNETPGSPDRTCIAALLRGYAGAPDTLVSSYFVGLIAECAIWSAALTDDEVTSIAKGFSPRRIRPQSLVFYAPLIRNLADIKGGRALTNNNSATVADHPRVY